MADNCSPKVQVKLTDIYKGQPYRAQTGMLDFAFSAANGSAVQAKMVQQNGKDSVYAITRRTSVCTTIVDCGDVACTDAGTDVTLTACDTFTGFSCKSSEWHNLQISALRDIGSMEVTEVLSGHVYDQMQAIKAAVDVAVLVSMNSSAGSISTSVATKQLKLIDDTTKAPVWGVDKNIMLDFADAGYPDMPILIGNRTTALYKDAVSRSGINQYGQQLNTINSLNAFYDINVNSTNTAPTNAGNDVVFAVLPQIVNVLSWSSNTGVFSSRNQFQANDINAMKMVNTDNSTYSFSSLIDPATGMLFDLDIVFDPKCKKFQWRVYTYYKVLVNPLVGCKDAAFNGIVKYDVCPLSDTYCLNP
jgi:hypothetical protein